MKNASTIRSHIDKLSTVWSPKVQRDLTSHTVPHDVKVPLGDKVRIPKFEFRDKLTSGKEEISKGKKRLSFAAWPTPRT